VHFNCTNEDPQIYYVCIIMTPWIDDNFYAIDVNVCEHLWIVRDLHGVYNDHLWTP
jgi:hypothetical protein